MDWLNIHTSTLDSPEFVGSSPVERSTWLCLLRFCIGQENGGRIVGARGWKDRQWQQLARVTLREVGVGTRLWRWENDDLVVGFYPKDKEDEVRSRREVARQNGANGGRPKKTDVGIQKKPTLVNSGKAEGEGEGEGEGKGSNTPQPPVGGQAADAAGVVAAVPTVASPAAQTPEKPPQEPKPAPAEVEIPPALQTPVFSAAWAEWLAYRRERRLSAYKPRGLRKLYAQLAEWGASAACESIAESIRNNWQGLFPPRPVPGHSPGPKRLETDMTHEDLKRLHGGTF